MIKSVILAALISVLALPTTAQTFGGSGALTQPVGTMFQINVVSNASSTFIGTFRSNFSYVQSIQNPIGTTTFTRNFNFSGNADYNIMSQVNQTVTSFTSSGWNFNR